MANKTNSMAHTKWTCKYHIVFTPKYRRKAIYNQYKESLRDIIKQLCSYKGVEIIEGHLMPDHIHMLVKALEDSLGYLQAKHEKSEILYEASVESCQKNGWHVQGERIGTTQKITACYFGDDSLYCQRR